LHGASQMELRGEADNAHSKHDVPSHAVVEEETEVKAATDSPGLSLASTSTSAANDASYHTPAADPAISDAETYEVADITECPRDEDDVANITQCLRDDDDGRGFDEPGDGSAPRSSAASGSSDLIARAAANPLLLERGVVGGRAESVEQSSSARSSAASTTRSFGSPLFGFTRGEPNVAEEPATGGANLFLTCLRLRFEEIGNWEQALRRRSSAALSSFGVGGGEAEASADTASGRNESGGAQADELDSVGDAVARAPSWKEWAGRNRGAERYRPGDFVRGLTRKLKGGTNKESSEAEVADQQEEKIRRGG